MASALRWPQVSWKSARGTNRRLGVAKRRLISYCVESDHTVILTAVGSVEVYPEPLLRVNYLDVETRKRFKFLTNNFALPAAGSRSKGPGRFQVFRGRPVVGELGFAVEESAGSSFLRRDGTVWSTDKDGIIAALLATEITAKIGLDKGIHIKPIKTF